jgi:hypothetical protein
MHSSYTYNQEREEHWYRATGQDPAKGGSMDTGLLDNYMTLKDQYTEFILKSIL